MEQSISIHTFLIFDRNFESYASLFRDSTYILWIYIYNYFPSFIFSFIHTVSCTFFKCIFCVLLVLYNYYFLTHFMFYRKKCASQVLKSVQKYFVLSFNFLMIFFTNFLVKFYVLLIIYFSFNFAGIFFWFFSEVFFLFNLYPKKKNF